MGVRVVEAIASSDVDDNGYDSEFLEEGVHLVRIVSPEAMAGIYEVHSHPWIGFSGHVA